MKVYQVISVFKHDLNYDIQLIGAFKSFRNAKNYILLKCCKCYEKIDGPRHNLFCDVGEYYIASCRIDGTPCGFEDFYIKSCPILDNKKEEK